MLLRNILILPMFTLYLTGCRPVSDEVVRLSYDPSQIRFLEEAEGAEARAWAKELSQNSIQEIEKDPRFVKIKKTIEQLNYSKNKSIPCSLYDGYVYQVWNDDKNPVGIWRRMPLTEYKKGSGHWEILIDFDKLSQSMGQKIVFKNSILCRQKPNRYFIVMSFGNKDEQFVREWDLSTKQFVEEGFVAKRSDGSYVGDKLLSLVWLNADTVLIYFAKDPARDRNSSGYPKDIYIWRRGEHIEQAQKIHSMSEGG